jgi:uncharacterized protein (DUF2249 family)
MTTEHPQAGDHHCSCGEVAGEIPELDARSLPKEIRHAAILGALDGLKPGESFVLVAPHEPVPLLEKASARFGDALKWKFGDAEPDKFRVCFTKVK